LDFEYVEGDRARFQESLEQAAAAQPGVVEQVQNLGRGAGVGDVDQVAQRNPVAGCDGDVEQRAGWPRQIEVDERGGRRRLDAGGSAGWTIPARDAGGASAMLCAWSTCPECRDRRWTG
jgi:hypothetical protein